MNIVYCDFLPYFISSHVVVQRLRVRFPRQISEMNLCQFITCIILQIIHLKNGERTRDSGIGIYCSICKWNNSRFLDANLQSVF